MSEKNGTKFPKGFNNGKKLQFRSGIASLCVAKFPGVEGDG